MATVLYIKANAKPDHLSRTMRIANAFVEKYQELHPEDEIITLDLYKEKIGFLQEEQVLKHLEPRQQAARPVLQYAYQSMPTSMPLPPFWNLSYPAILKAYIIIYRCGVTFKYTSESGRLVRKQKGCLFVTRGGNYSTFSEFDRAKDIAYHSGLYGITDFTTFAADDMDRSARDVTVIADYIDKAYNLPLNSNGRI